MEIKSNFLGEQSIDPSTIINFPNGIPGFEDQTRFKLFHQKDKENPQVFWLQSVDKESLTLAVAQPSIFNINYVFVLSDAEEALLEAEDPADLLILVILLKDASGQPTIQDAIKYPLVINCAKRIGLQKMLAQINQSITLTETSNEINVSESA
jgi:flagellar assembly factor FliW